MVGRKKKGAHCTEEEPLFCFTGESLGTNKHLSPRLKYQKREK